MQTSAVRRCVKVRARLLASRDPYFVPSLVYVRETQYWVRVGLSKSRKILLSSVNDEPLFESVTSHSAVRIRIYDPHDLYLCIADSDGDQYNNK